MLVYVRPSNEALLRARVLGARGGHRIRFLPTFPETGLLDAFHCAHRATTVLSWGLCEQEEREVPR